MERRKRYMRLIVKRMIKEGKVNDAIRLYEEMVELTRMEEGCICYDLFQDEENPRILAVFEEWSSDEALAKHQETEHFKRIVPMIGEITEKRLEMGSYNKLI